MCLFSGSVEAVAKTKIFARVEGNEQFLVYEMEFSAAEDLAMVLPIPVVAGSGEDAVRFISFEDYPRFFEDLHGLFMQELGEDLLSLPVAAAAPLEVHSVGAFDASFVPTIADFSRLDSRFRLPDGVWNDLPGYQNFGFAVFKLKSGSNQRVHPMAFAFPTSDPSTLFFPTVHVHDGSVRSHADFDHVLYCQTEGVPPSWEKSDLQPSEADIRKAHGVLGYQNCYRLELSGEMKNQDTYACPFEDAA